MFPELVKRKDGSLKSYLNLITHIREALAFQMGVIMNNDLTQSDKDWIDTNLKNPISGTETPYGIDKPQIYDPNAKTEWHKKDDIDRTIPYKKFVNGFDINGFCTDIDNIKWKLIDGEYKPCAIMELTASDWETVATEQYRNSIEDRILRRGKQGAVMEALGKLLNVPVYWVLFPPGISWIYVFSLNKRIWKLFTPAEWIDFMQKL